jgi:lipopolysaccharide transport system ATP-binding protein
MSSEIAVAVRNLSKCYAIYARPSDRLRQSIALRLQRLAGKPGRVYYREFWALRDVSFEIARGETLGIVGRNGAGKSTLLQIICGTLTQSFGSVDVRGRVAALLELGSGFNPDFSGRENVFLNASLFGLTREQIEERLDAILAFADIGDFIDQPVKTYSSGMAVRLAFAVQAQLDPDVLIVDEALAVGDIRFQAKCFRRLKELQDAGTTILFVSHSPDQVVKHCTRAILLEGGRLLEDGHPKSVSNMYLDILFGSKRLQLSKSTDVAPKKLPEMRGDFARRLGYNPAEYRWGDRRAEILDYQLLDAEARETVHLTAERDYILRIKVSFHAPVVRPVFGFYIKTIDGLQLTGANSRDFPAPGAAPVGQADEGDIYVATFTLRPRFKAGEYMLSVGVAEDVDGELVPLDRRYDSILVHLGQESPHYGLTYTGCACAVEIAEVKQLERA